MQVNTGNRPDLANIRDCAQNSQVVFEPGERERHKTLRVSLGTFLRRSPIISYITFPVIYALLLPLTLLDLSVTIYQWICFSAWRIKRVRRADFIVFDRHHLDYLNAVQKLNCSYCSYANGVIAYAREIASRTEQFWCPIKHSLRVRGGHDRYKDFPEYGDAEGFIEKSASLRRELKDPKDAF